MNINDLLELKLNGKLQLYADNNSSITYIAANLNELHKTITDDMRVISNWFEENRLVLHADKTEMLIFNSKRKEFENIPPIFSNDSEIMIVDEFKYLGLPIDSSLSRNSHINKLMKKVSPYVDVFRRISFISCDHVKRVLYYAFFYSNIIDSLTLWNRTK